MYNRIYPDKLDLFMRHPECPMKEADQVVLCLQFSRSVDPRFSICRYRERDNTGTFHVCTHNGIMSLLKEHYERESGDKNAQV